MTKLLSGVARLSNGLRPTVEQWQWSRNRRAFIRRTKVSAAWVGARIDLQVAKDVKISKSARVSFKPESTNVMHVAWGVRIGERVHFDLRDGGVYLAELAEIRHDSMIKSAGRFTMGYDTVISWHSTIHCSQSITLARHAGLAERVTVTDSTHYFTDPDVNFYRNTKMGTVEIGENCWVGAGAIVTRNSTLGSHCIVAANSVVSGKVPDGHLARGVPATLHPLALPWDLNA